MYCPSCDKSYGAVHSRCPECHSWLKVSAPAGSRAKSAKAVSATVAGSVSTLDKEPMAWADPPSTSGPDWGGAGSAADSWADVLPAPAAVPQTFSLDPAPVSDSWGGGSAWGGSAATSDSWAASDEPEISLAPAPKPATAAPASTPGGAWLAGGDDDGWGGRSEGAKAPTAPKANGSLGLAQADDDGWGGSSSSLASAPSLALGGLSGQAPVPGAPPDLDGDGWGAGTSSAVPTSTAKSSVPAPAQGWLGGDSAGAVVEEDSAGWLGDSRTPKVGAPAGDGWLGGEQAGKGPSMTEMVDRAIGVEEADDFVDDSWVDEEVGNGEFDDLEVPEYVPPTPEVGGLFLKLLLVAVLVLMVGGGIMFLGQEKKTPEQLQAEQKAKDLEFARSTIESGKAHLKEGKAFMAIGPLEAGIVTLKTTGGTEEEILAAKVELARALMKSQDYEKAYGHWAALVKGPEAYKKEAKGQMVEAGKLLRAQATEGLNEALVCIKNGESASVVLLGEKALKIFEKYQGTASQKGKAYATLGRGYINGREYGKAKDYLKKAIALNPAGNYQVYINEINALSAPASYYSGGGGGYDSEPANRRVQPVKVDASIGDGPAYSTVRGGGGGRRTRRTAGASSSGGQSSSSAPVAKPRTKEIPAYQRAPKSGGSGGRRGSQGVLPTY